MLTNPEIFALLLGWGFFAWNPTEPDHAVRRSGRDKLGPKSNYLRSVIERYDGDFIVNPLGSHRAVSSPSGNDFEMGDASDAALPQARLFTIYPSHGLQPAQTASVLVSAVYCMDGIQYTVTVSLWGSSNLFGASDGPSIPFRQVSVKLEPMESSFSDWETASFVSSINSDTAMFELGYSEVRRTVLSERIDSTVSSSNELLSAQDETNLEGSLEVSLTRSDTPLTSGSNSACSSNSASGSNCAYGNSSAVNDVHPDTLSNIEVYHMLSQSDLVLVLQIETTRGDLKYLKVRVNVECHGS